MSNAILITGLGNPGRKYKKTRHNIGFRIMGEFQKENSFPKFKFEKKFHADVSEGMVGDKKIILNKPQTFMNASGTAVKLIFNFKFSISKQFSMNQFSNLIVVHDDLDLPLGEIKISKNKGSAGHKGVESIIQELGTQNFTRLRIGIKPKADYDRVVINSKELVLKKFSKDEKQTLEQVTKNSIEKIQSVISAR